MLPPMLHRLVLHSALTALVLAAACTSSGDQTDSCPQGEGLIAEGVARFSPSEVSCEELPASMALLEAMPPTDAIPSTWPTPVVLDAEGEIYRAAIPIAGGPGGDGAGGIAGARERTAPHSGRGPIRPTEHKSHRELASSSAPPLPAQATASRARAPRPC